ncbi:MAG: DUF2793 domain-containing protein, partial [Sphingomonadaceae bacterium]
NEALAQIDLLLSPVVQSVAPVAVPASPTLGECWIVGTGATGAWLGQNGAIAGWTASGWRFVPPREGMAVWSMADSRIVRRLSDAWVISGQTVIIDGNQVVGARRGAILAPTGGTTIDAAARGAINEILLALRGHGLIAA